MINFFFRFDIFFFLFYFVKIIFALKIFSSSSLFIFSWESMIFLFCKFSSEIKPSHLHIFPLCLQETDLFLILFVFLMLLLYYPHNQFEIGPTIIPLGAFTNFDNELLIGCKLSISFFTHIFADFFIVASSSYIKEA